MPPNSFQSTLDGGTLQNAFPGQGYRGYNGLDYQTTKLANPFAALNSPGDVGTPNINDLNWPRTYNASLSLAKRLPWRQVLEVGYVGTWGRQLVAQQNVNIVPEGGLFTSYSQDPLLLAALDGTRYNTFRNYPTLANVNLPVYVGVSDYNSMQATLSRQSGNFTYLVAYTLSQVPGHGGERLRRHRSVPGLGRA